MEPPLIARSPQDAPNRRDFVQGLGAFLLFGVMAKIS